jgi:RHS repeat-associated protein
VTERYVIDRNQIALVFDGAGVQTHRYLYGTAVDQVLADETATGMVWALADREDTVNDLVDNSGNVVNHITYDSFGKVVNQSNSSVVFRYGYTGREQDAETGLDYYRARYYDSGVGRFISEDPTGFEAEDTNLYRYVGNNSVNLTDSSGQKVDIVPGTFTRKIFYDNKTGQHYTNNIEYVIEARKRDNTTSITNDVVSAALFYSGIGNNNLGTKVSPALKPKIPDKLPGDQNGHIVGKQLGGSGDVLNNLFAQRGRGYNQDPSPWRRFEDRVRNEIQTEYTELPQPSSDGTCPSPIQNPQKAHQTALYGVTFRYPYAILRPDLVVGSVVYFLPFRGVNTEKGVARYPAAIDGVYLNN